MGVELLLLTGAAGMARNVGQDQSRLSLLLRNPWFVVGGLVFVLAGIDGGRGRARPGAPAGPTGNGPGL